MIDPMKHLDNQQTEYLTNQLIDRGGIADVSQYPARVVRRALANVRAKGYTVTKEAEGWRISRD